jgi:methylthioribose-1-phosphate isomerase
MTPEYSPLFEPVLWRRDGFEILNEILLPATIEYIQVTDVAQAVDAVREMKTRAFGQVLTFLYSGALVGRRYQGKKATPLEAELGKMTQRFCSVRPTFDFQGLGESFSQWLRELPAGAEPGAWIEARAREMAASILSARHSRAKRTAAALPQRARLLTHCNVSGELVAVTHYCQTMGKDISVVTTETRPYLQGTRLTAWELARAGVPVSVIPDCAIAQVMADGKVQAVIVGSDRCARNGDIINKVGTYPLALMAREYKVPFHVLVQYPGTLEDGANVEIEERPVEELLNFQGQPLLAEGSDRIKARYPAFDVTPAELVTSLIGFEGQWSPETFRARYQGQAKPGTNIPRSKRPEGRYLLVYGLPQAKHYEELVTALTTEPAESLLVPEMRPHLWGVHFLARELLRRGTPTALISDSMMGALFSQGEISRLYLCCRESPGRGITGIAGSLLALQLARAHGVPVELLESSGDVDVARDQDVSTFLGQNVLPPGVSIYPLRTEVIPTSLVAKCKRNRGGR